jgi:hypothetical protein
MDLESLLADPPMLHRDQSGEAVSWGLPSDVIRWMWGRIDRGSRTLETGGGLSTVMFALSGAEHTCITPSSHDVAAVRAFCRTHGISDERVTYVVDRSENVLPRAPIGDLNLALIDGRHGFPATFIDWYYTAGPLKRGGALVVDDTQLWPSRVLKEFLMAEPRWRLEREFHRTVTFTKLRDGSESAEWGQQLYTVLQSDSPRPERVMSALLFDALVLVVSKGDDELLKLPCREAWHFPRGQDRGYAGFHPGDSQEAIEHLEELRGMGADAIVFPSSAFWWLEHYDAFHQHLESRYRRAWADDRFVIYHLVPAHAPGRST